MRHLLDRVLSKEIFSDERLSSGSQNFYFRMRHARKRTQTGYSRAFGIDKSIVCRRLNELEKSGWVYTFPDPVSRRPVYVNWMPLDIEERLAREVAHLVDISPHRGETLMKYMLYLMVDESYVLYNSRYRWLIAGFGKGRMELDVFFPDIKVAVEFQGRQHFETVTFHNGKTNLQEQQARDRAKYLACERQKVKLIEIEDIELSYFTLKAELEGSVPLMEPLQERPIFRIVEQLCQEHARWARDQRSAKGNVDT